MKLYDIDYHTISSEDTELWQKIREKEILNKNGKLTNLRISRYYDYPKAVRHFLSLFPNNFIETIDLKQSKEILLDILNRFILLIDETITTERDILNFIRNNQAWFIIGSLFKNNYPFGHHGMYIFPEFRLPSNYQIDYLLVGENSDGHHFIFVEFENPYKDITLQDGSFGSTIRKGIKQIDDWETWIEQNFSTLKLVFENAQNRNKILPKEFRDFDKTRMHYMIVAGRRSDYTERTYKLRRNNQEQRKLLILHYDNLIDNALRIIKSDWF